ncbi:MAG: phosphotransferase [Clostridium sp.]|uniref:phosphotransferase n=1 Tax=Clostridium sp. TaxID=1506 RepID=UPI003D6D6FF7
MVQNEILKGIDSEMLKSIVVKVVEDDSIEIINWSSEILSGGTIGDVFLIKGTCIKNTMSELNSETSSCIEWSVILKILKERTRFGDPESWSREVKMYQSDIFNNLSSNIRVPKCLSISKNENNEIWLWMEHVNGKTGNELSLEDYGLVSRHLGELQGRYMQGDKLPKQSWLSTEFLATSQVVMWGTPAISWLLSNEFNPEECGLNSEILQKVIKLWSERDIFINVLNKLPKTLCHRDFNPGNIVVEKGINDIEKVVLFDWDCTGIGVIGEDVADLFMETLVFYDYDIDKAYELRETILKSYLSGLESVGWEGNREVIRIAFDLVIALHWTFRIICRTEDTDDSNAINRYSKILSFILERIEEVGELIG